MSVISLKEINFIAEKFSQISPHAIYLVISTYLIQRGGDSYAINGDPVISSARLVGNSTALYSENTCCVGWVTDGIVIYYDKNIVMADCTISSGFFTTLNPRYATANEIIFQATLIPGIWRFMLECINSKSIASNLGDRKTPCITFKTAKGEKSCMIPHSAWDLMSNEFVDNYNIIVPFEVDIKTAEHIMTMLNKKQIHLYGAPPQIVLETFKVIEFLGISFKH